MITKEENKKLYDLIHEWNNQWRECLSESHRTGVYSGVGMNIDKAYNKLSNFIDSLTQSADNPTKFPLEVILDMDKLPKRKPDFRAIFPTEHTA